MEIELGTGRRQVVLTLMKLVIFPRRRFPTRRIPLAVPKMTMMLFADLREGFHFLRKISEEISEILTKNKSRECRAFPWRFTWLKECGATLKNYEIQQIFFRRSWMIDCQGALLVYS